MANEKNTQTANPFETAKSAVVLKPKSTPELCFIYRGMADLKNLIQFVGSRPIINEDMSIQIKKTVIPENSVIWRNPYGEVTKCMTFEQAFNSFEIAASNDFDSKFANKVLEKPVKARTKKEKK
jgi:hypothetical protein